MKELYTLGQIEWNKIKIGEVFAYRGCWTIAVKTNEKKATVLDCDCRIPSLLNDFDKPAQSMGKEYTRKTFKWIGDIEYPNIFMRGNKLSFALTTSPTKLSEDGFYKLPVSIQRLWRTD